MKTKNIKEKSNVIRYNTTIKYGLNTAQINERKENGHINKESKLPTKSFGRIFYDNLFTLFNLINIIIAIVILFTGSYTNALFLGVVFFNVVIGTFQEIRAKKAVEKLSFISATKIKTIRNSKEELINIDEILLDDIIVLSNGNQIPCDCITLENECDVNESLITGESDAIHKKVGDTLYSGSFIVSGKCTVKADKVGDDTYVASVFSGAKYIKKLNSEIMYTLKKFIKYVSIAILPIGTLFFITQMNTLGGDFNETVLSTAAVLISMIPEGLMLLTSSVLAVSVIRLSSHKVLVQELYCIETLARVDVLCLDKTGTITEGSMELNEVIHLDNSNKEEVENALNLLTSSLEDNNPTFNAIKDKFSEKLNDKVAHIVPFSSDKKWSGASFDSKGTYIIGAAEFIFKNVPENIAGILKDNSEKFRVLILAKSDEVITDNNLPTNLIAIGVLLIKDVIRKNASQTLKFFDEQGVDLKIISGDNVKTVSGIAKEVGFKNYDKYVDATTLKDFEEIKEASKRYSIFGRVTPVQKKELLLALKEEGHTVAMTGDGVNDVLALKEADCSVAMASGSEAARNVSQLVLLNSDFSAMPKVVEEGRRTINNIQRSAALFIVKNIYSTLLSIVFLFLPLVYPYAPIQMSLLNAFLIGIPSFVLALQPNKNRIKGSFFVNIVSRAVPVSLTMFFSILASVIVCDLFKLSHTDTSTVAVIVNGFIGIMYIIKLCIPFNALRIALVTLCIGGLVLGITLLPWIFFLNPYNITVLIISASICGFGAILFMLFNKLAKKINIEKRIKLKIK